MKRKGIAMIDYNILGKIKVTFQILCIRYP